ncbi:DUF1127 domain-containing protein [Pseudoroseicyclus sp. H15]
MTTVLQNIAPLALRLPAAGIVAVMHGLWLQRRALASLDQARLDDLGLSQADVAREAERPFWDVPATWRC